MSFEKKLNGKVLDPIHGTIMLTDIEKKVIGHPLFQRLHNIKQNTFLYKVFPSAMHSRFEHSLGVMYVAYKMMRSLIINSYRYQSKYNDNLIFKGIDDIADSNIQELRLAALLHDIGHGPMSHQFDSFTLDKLNLIKYLSDDGFSDVYALINNGENAKHEHISLIFIKKIIYDLELDCEVDVDNILKLIESGYKGGRVEIKIGDECYDIQPLFTSLISSCPIDADRMDYLLRDSYFSGVKCGVYNVERILMSIVPVIHNNKVYLAYKGSCLDSISEFIFSRSNLFSQVYFHKTNRSFSSMLEKVCSIVKSNQNKSYIESLYKMSNEREGNGLDGLQNFYIENSDEKFINDTVRTLTDSSNERIAGAILDDIIKRKPWKKFYEAKIYQSSKKITDEVNREAIKSIRNQFSSKLSFLLDDNDFIIDIMSDNAFKDIDKTDIKLLTKNLEGSYDLRSITECGDRLDIYQCIRYFIRVFISPGKMLDKCIAEELDEIKSSVFDDNK